MKNIKFIQLMGLLCMNGLLQAQNIASFESRLEGKTNFYEIMNIVNEEYKNLPQDIRDNGGEGYVKEKHWRRWELYMSSRLGKNGELVNVSQKNYAASLKIKKYQSLTKSTNSSWSQFGPFASSYKNSNSYCKGNGKGRVDRIAFHPTDPNIIYAGMPSGGLWKTTNGGTTWTNMLDFSASIGISGIVVSHANSNHIYVLTGDGDSNLTNGFVNNFGYIRPSIGVLKSIDGGVTWNQTGQLSTAASYLGYQLVQNPLDADNLWAATDDGLYRTDDGGTTWSQTRTGKVWDVAFKPGTERLYCVEDDNFYYKISVNTIAWNQTTFPGTPLGRKSIGVTSALTSRVYVFSGPVLTASCGGVFRSLNSGTSFSLSTNTPNLFTGLESGGDNGGGSSYNNCIAVDPTDPTDIVTGGVLIWRSTNSGITMVNSSSNDEAHSTGLPWVHGDCHDLEWNPLDNKLYAGHDGGVSVSTDGGVTWTDITNNMVGMQSYHMSKFAAGFPKFIVGNQDNGIKYNHNSSTDFTHISRGDGFDSDFVASDLTKFYATFNQSLALYTSTGDVRTIITPLSNTNWYKTVVAHNTNPDIVLCGSFDNYKSADQGSSWVNNGGSGSWSLAACGSNNSRFYSTGAGTFQNNSTGKAYRSDDTGDTWTDLSTSTGFPAVVTKLTDIEARPTNSTRVWMTCGGFEDGSKVYYSGNSGLTWTNRSGSLPNIPVHCVAVTSSNDAFIGTDIGIFYRADAMTDWIPFGNNMPNVPVTDIKVDESLDKVYASTFGRGVWSSPLPNGACVSSFELNGFEYGNQFSEASDYIETTQVISGSIENNILYQADNKVVFKPGFIAETSSFVRAYIHPCGTGGGSFFNGNGEVDYVNKAANNLDSEKINRSNFDLFRNKGSVGLSLNIKKESDYELRALDENYNTLSIILSKSMATGINTFSVKDISEDVFFVALFENGKQVYLQELDQ